MLRRLQSVIGVARSLRIYYGRRGHRAGLQRLYRQFVRDGDLVFDVGAHVGDRIAALRELGVRVVAVEPQPALVRVLRLLYGRDPAVAIEPVAIGRAAAPVELIINRSNPTISTASPAFIAAAAAAPGWADETWNERIQVDATTLDALIARHGMPAFIKIDVEGFEAEALAGLTSPVPALSFEFTTLQRDVAAAALERCVALGFDKFDASLGESHVLVHGCWQSAAVIRAWIAALPDAANSGDVYARR